MSGGIIIPTEKPTDLVTFTIKVNGNALPRTVMVLNIIIRNEVNRIPTAKITISDGDPAAETFEHSEGDLFRPGSDIEIFVGYHSAEKTVFKGLLISQKIRIRKNNSACLIVEAKDPAFKMTLVPKFRLFTEMKDSDIVDEILGEHGLNGEIKDTSTEHEHMVQNNVCDWDFILSRMEVNALLLTLDNGTLKCFSPDPSASATLAIAYGSTVLEADLEIDSRIQTATVKARSWVYTDQEILESESSYSNEPDAGDIKVNALSELNDTSEYYLNNAGKTTDSELSAWSDSHKMKMHFSKIRGTICFQGFPDLTPGNIIELNGFGKIFNGNAFVSGVCHEIVEGNFLTFCQIGLTPKFFLNEQKSETDAKLVPSIKGLHSGIVLQIEEDPKGENRILIHIPMLHPDGEGVWSRISTLYAGENRGSFFMPDIDDEVLVGFFDNDPRYPVVLGMMNSSAKPAPITAANDNFEKGFVTKNELKILFNEDTKTIDINTPKGNIVKLDEDEGGISIKDENDNSLLLSSDGITIESCKDIIIKAIGDISLEGVNIESTADGEFKADGSSGAKLTTSATCTIKGSLVEIN